MKAHMKKLLILTGFALCLAGLARADLAGQIDNIISESLQKRVRFSIRIVEADSGDKVYEHNAKEIWGLITFIGLRLGFPATHWSLSEAATRCWAMREPTLSTAGSRAGYSRT